MKVALVTKPTPTMTGLRRYAESLIDPLRSLGVDVTIAHPKAPLSPAVVRLGRRFGFDLPTFFESYPFAVDTGGADLCHLTSQTLATLLRFGRLPPSVVTVLDIIPFLVRNDRKLGVYRHAGERLFDRFALSSLRRARAIIAISRFTRQTLIDALRLPPGRIHVVHCAIDRGRFRSLSVPFAFRLHYNLDEACAYVLHVGSEDPRKNVETLIRAFALVHREAPHARLLRVGGAHFSEQRRMLLELTHELSLQDAVRFVDDVPDEDLPYFYNSASVFVFPSRYEGFGLPVLEAMSCGTPVIASDASSLPEVVGPGGVLLAPDDVRGFADQILRVLSSDDARAAASAAALAQADRFSMARQAAETLAVYQHCLS